MYLRRHIPCASRYLLKPHPSATCTTRLLGFELREIGMPWAVMTVKLIATIKTDEENLVIHSPNLISASVRSNFFMACPQFGEEKRYSNSRKGHVNSVSIFRLFSLAPNAFVHEAGPVLHFNLLFRRPLFAFAHLRRLVSWHHLFHRCGLHPIRRKRRRDTCEKHREDQHGGKCGRTTRVHGAPPGRGPTKKYCIRSWPAKQKHCARFTHRGGNLGPWHVHFGL